MDTINRTNYDAYLFLYQEGELDAKGVAEVENFLAQNPDIKAEMEQFYDPELVVTAQPTKKRITFVPWRWTAAACVALVAGGVAWYQLQSPRVATLPGKPTAIIAQTIPQENLQPTSATVQEIVHKVKAIKSVQKTQTIAEVSTFDTMPLIAENHIENITEPVEEPLTVEPTQPIIIYTNKLAQVNEVRNVNYLAQEAFTGQEYFQSDRYSPIFQFAENVSEHARQYSQQVVQNIAKLF